MELIRDSFETEVENPNQPHHQVGYREFKEKYQGHPTKSGMTYFYELVLPECYGCVCQIYLDGKWGAGVAHEAAFYIKKGEPVWVIEPGTTNIRPLKPEEEILIAQNDPSLVLTIEETRFRIWGHGEPYKKALPYEEAHLVQ